MVSTTITFENTSVTPPVFVAGTFTKWTAVELECETTITDNIASYTYTKNFEIEAGEQQYKFRLGPGDWWVVDESKPKSASE